VKVGVASMDKKEFLPVKSDIIFRLFFADERNENFLICFLKSVLRLPEDDYNEIEIADPSPAARVRG